MALVVAALSPTRAAEFLTHWSPDRQTEILRRVAELSDADESFVSEMQDELVMQLSRDAEVRGASTGWQYVRSILSAAPRSERDRLLDRLAESDGNAARALASASGQNPQTTAAPVDANEIAVAFDRFVDLDQRTLVKVFVQLPIDVSALALAGASQPCLADILSRLPPEMSRQLEQRLGRMGPLRLSDIQRAQQAAVDLGRRAVAAATAAAAPTHLKLMA